jgi:D-serine deaminase-like pyridoxal phosphate-dependent protein
MAEAHFFADAGFTDILYAVPFPVYRFSEVVSLQEKFPSLQMRLMLDHPETLSQLCAARKPVDREISIFLKIDCGCGRAGVDPTLMSSVALAKDINAADGFSFAGIYSFSGHSYGRAGGNTYFPEV